MVTATIKSKSMIISCVAAATTFILTTAIRFTILPIYSEKELSLNEVEIGLVLTIIALVNFFMIKWAGSISDKVGAVLTMIYGFTLSGLTIILYAFSSNLLTLLLIASAFGVATSLIMPAQVSLAVESSNPEHRGLSMGVYRIFSDVGLVVGPLLSGVLIEFLPLAYAFYFIAGICFSTALFIYLAH